MPSPIVVAVSAPGANSGDDSLSVNYPAGVQQWDDLFIVYWIDAGTGETVTGNTANVVTGGTGLRRGVGVHCEVATGLGNFVLDGLSIATSAGTGNVRAIAIACRGGALVGTQVEGQVTRIGTANSTSCAMPVGGIVSTGTEELGLVVFFYNNTGTITDLAGFINNGNQNDGVNSWNVQYAWMPTATTISALTATLGTTGISAAVALAINPQYLSSADVYGAPVSNVVSVG